MLCIFHGAQFEMKLEKLQKLAVKHYNANETNDLLQIWSTFSAAFRKNEITRRQIMFDWFAPVTVHELEGQTLNLPISDLFLNLFS